jgi:osmotically-inducible protein OsmY
MALEPQTRNLELEISKRFEEQGLLEIAELELWVRGGVVFIEGAVSNLKQKKLAGEVAGQVEGVRDVVNMLRITPLPFIDDESLKKHIRRTLARNPRIDKSRILVEVINGLVHLGGFVNTVTEKRLIEQEVWAVAGVRDIINKIEVLSATPKSEKSEIQIKGEILQSFSECLGLDLSKVGVEIRDGVARLSGMVPTDYLKEAAEELATWTPSITGVINELKVLELPISRGHTPTRLIRSPVDDCSRNIGIADSGSIAEGSNSLGSATTRSSLNASKTTNQI